MSRDTILVPKRVFLDTGHLVELSKIQRGDTAHIARQPQDATAARRTILRGLIDGLIQPVIAFDQAYEWIMDSRAAGQELAQVLDVAQNCYEVTGTYFVFVLEAVAEAARLTGRDGIRIPEPLHLIKSRDAAMEFVLENAPALRRQYEESGLHAALHALRARGVNVGGRQFRSVAHLVEISADVAAQDKDATDTILGVFLAGMGETKSVLSKEKGARRARLLERLQRLDIMLDLLSGLGIASQADKVWTDFNIERCPALDLWSRFWWRFVSAKQTLVPNDVADVAFLPAYCYADFALTERAMRGHIIAANKDYASRVFSNPVDLCQAMRL